MFIQQKRGLSVSPPIIITCELCNTLENLDECNPPGDILRIMSKRNVCSKCAFWMDKIAHPDIGNEVIGSHYYIVYPFVKRPNNVIKGSEGKEFYIRRFDGTLIKSNNIWHQGEIPEHFRKQLPDTANFLSLITYTKLSNDPHKCHAKDAGIAIIALDIIYLANEMDLSIRFRPIILLAMKTVLHL